MLRWSGVLVEALSRSGFRVIRALLAMALGGLASAAATDTPGDLPRFDGLVGAVSPMVIKVPAPDEARLRCVLAAIREPGKVRPEEALEGRFESGAAVSGQALRLHLDQGDSDVVEIIRQAPGEPLRIVLSWSGGPDA